MPAVDRLSPELQYQIVHTLGFTGLRPVQELTIDAVLAGDNCVVLAPTAGGKTEAAFFPLLSAMDAADWRPVSVLYLSPIRALLNNQEERIARYAATVGRTVFKWHGDVPAGPRKRFLTRPADILLTTPESLEAITIQPYKGNRTQPKPPYLPDVRQYMVEIWRATVVDGKEADDQVAIEYLKDPANRCIVSIDKDPDQIPGNHSNYRKDLFYEVSEAEAAYDFWVQVLTGDRVDNIRGIPGIGPKKAEKLWQQCAHSEYHMYEIAKREYALAYPDNPNALQEHCDLLYIWRKENDKWAPPT